MSEKKNLQEGYQPNRSDDLGYKARRKNPVDPKDLKPPKGGSAVKRPQNNKEGKN